MASSNRSLLIVLSETVVYWTVIFSLIGFEPLVKRAVAHDTSWLASHSKDALFACTFVLILTWLQSILTVAGGATYDIAAATTASLEPFFGKTVILIRLAYIAVGRRLLDAAARVIAAPNASDSLVRPLTVLFIRAKVARNVWIYGALFIAFALNLALGAIAEPRAVVAIGTTIIATVLLIAVNDWLLAFRLRNNMFGTRLTEARQLFSFLAENSEPTAE